MEAILRILLITREVVEEFLWIFWRAGICLSNNKTFDFGVDPDHDPDQGFLTEFFYHCGKRTILRILRWVASASSLSVVFFCVTHFFTLRAKLSGAVYCNRSCLWRAGGVCLCTCVCLWVCYHDNSKLRASILTKLGLYFVGKGSDHLQLIKFWPSCAPGKGAGSEIFGSACLTTASAHCSVCVYLSAFFHLTRNTQETSNIRRIS